MDRRLMLLILEYIFTMEEYKKNGDKYNQNLDTHLATISGEIQFLLWDNYAEFVSDMGNLDFLGRFIEGK